MKGARVILSLASVSLHKHIQLKCTIEGCYQNLSNSIALTFCQKSDFVNIERQNVYSVKHVTALSKLSLCRQLVLIDLSLK